MLDLSPEKVLLLGIIALVVLGPHRLPQAARHLGQFVGQMRRMTSSFQSEVRDALGEPVDTFTSAISEISARSVPGSIRRALIPTATDPAARRSPGSPPSSEAASPDSAASSPSQAAFADLGAMRPPDDPSLN